MPDARPRRTFAVISHPDAGKSTLTEALALHARAITEAGAVHGKGERRATVSDWMAMEKARGISITSAALQFVYRDHVINLVDTPGHSDFSEDTYRVLSAVDSAVMLVDAGKGLEPQTLKLFRVCALRGIPVITVINKWDRPGLSALELMDLIEQKIKLRPTPLTWPASASPTAVWNQRLSDWAAAEVGWPETTGARRGMSRTGMASGKTLAASPGEITRRTMVAPDPDAEARDWLSPTTRKAGPVRRSCAHALTMISGPMPAGSPRVRARGRVFTWSRLSPSS